MEWMDGWRVMSFVTSIFHWYTRLCVFYSAGIAGGSGYFRLLRRRRFLDAQRVDGRHHFRQRPGDSPVAGEPGFAGEPRPNEGDLKGGAAAAGDVDDGDGRRVDEAGFQGGLDCGGVHHGWSSKKKRRLDASPPLFLATAALLGAD